MQEYLRGELIALASKPDITTLVERVRARKRAAGSRLDFGQILGHRDAERR